ncbi:ankyrin-2 isoform X1 [Hydra vulgaris]|uniref:ankyrin-2 isoform X1 n=1 Tax=Hydra vulgaris TaxID=6087 RepID=UPI001F5F413B|nr:ankyrin-2-like [Hydra vulgaris]
MGYSSKYIHKLVLLSDINNLNFLLRNYPSEVNCRNTSGLTALHLAVIYSNTNALKMLLNHGINANFQNNEGKTALHLAVQLSNLIAVKHLLNYNTNVNLKDNNGFSPLHLSLCSQSYLSNQEAFILLLKNGAKVNVKSFNGITPLHIAANRKYHKAAKILLHAGADINAADNYGVTALHYAVWNADFKMIKILLKNGINEVIRSDCAKTAVQLGLESRTVNLFLGSNEGFSVALSSNETLLPVGRDQMFYTHLQQTLTANSCSKLLQQTLAANSCSKLLEQLSIHQLLLFMLISRVSKQEAVANTVRSYQGTHRSPIYGLIKDRTAEEHLTRKLPSSSLMSLIGLKPVSNLGPLDLANEKKKERKKNLNERITQFQSVAKALIDSGIRYCQPSTIVHLYNTLTVLKLIYGLELCKYDTNFLSKIDAVGRAVLKSFFCISKYSKNYLHSFFKIEDISTILLRNKVNLFIRLLKNQTCYSLIVNQIQETQNKKSFTNKVIDACNTLDLNFIQCMLNGKKIKLTQPIVELQIIILC